MHTADAATKRVLETFDLYTPFAGITNNAAEANNSRIKRLLDFKEREIDVIVLYFYYFQNIDTNILKGFCNIGEYKLKPKFTFAAVDSDEISAE